MLIKKIFKSVFICALIFGFGLIRAPQVLAHCPLCVVGAASGITLTRLFGVDDSITGIWIGAFLGAVSVWTLNIISRKLKTSHPIFLEVPIYLIVFITTIWSFYKFGLIIEMEKMYGLHKLTFGIIVGGFLFFLVDKLNGFIKSKAGRSFFPYQRIVFSLGAILLASFIDYIWIGYYL